MINKQMEKKFNAITIVLLIFLIVLLGSNIFDSIFYTNIISISLAIAYLVALIGVIQKQSYGSIVAIITGLIELIITIILSVTTNEIYFILIVDIILVIFAFLEYQKITQQPIPQQPIHHRIPEFCPLCGGPIGEKFCTMCGNKIE